MSTTSKFERCYDYVGAYEHEWWGQASAHAWGRLEAIANEYQRGEYDWERAVELLDDTVDDIIPKNLELP